MMSDLSIVIPAHKEDPKFLYELYQSLIWYGCEVIIVDDGDDMELECPHIYHRPNMGYGYAIKRGIHHATRPLIMTLDADGQHTVDDAVKLYRAFKSMKNFKMVVGCRYNLEEKWFRRLGRKCINFLASCIAGHYFIDLNSGMRIFQKDLAIGYSPILCDTFSFTTSLTMSMVTDKHNVFWFPIEVKPRNNGKSRVKVFRDGLITIYYVVMIGFALRTRWIRSRLRSLTGR